MSRIQTVDPTAAEGRAKQLLDGVKAKLGTTPNMMRAMANSPAVLDAYLQFSAALGGGALAAKDRERIALAVGEANGCQYCLSAHSAIGKMVGLTDEQIREARRGHAVDEKSDAVITLASVLVEKRGLVSDDDVARAKRAGLNDGEIAEVVANTALNLFTNYFNHLADVEVDFPAIESLEPNVNSEACSAATGAVSA